MGTKEFHIPKCVMCTIWVNSETQFSNFINGYLQHCQKFLFKIYRCIAASYFIHGLGKIFTYWVKCVHYIICIFSKTTFSMYFFLTITGHYLLYGLLIMIGRWESCDFDSV